MRRIEGDAVVERTATHEVEVAAGVDAAYGLLADVASWPRFMDAVTVGRVAVPAGPDGIEEVEITADGLDGPVTWRSARHLDPRGHAIRFSRLQPPLPLIRMEGTWRVEPRGEGRALVRLDHEWATLDEETADAYAAAVRRNASTDLAGLRRVLEPAGEVVG